MDWEPELSVWFPFCLRSSLFCSFVQELQQTPETAPPFCCKAHSSDRGEKQLWLAVQFNQQKQQKKSRQHSDAPKIQGKRKNPRVWRWILSFYTILSFQSFLDPINRPVMVLHYFSHAARSHFSSQSSNDVILTSSRLLTQPPLQLLIWFYEICQSSTHYYWKKKKIKPSSHAAT